MDSVLVAELREKKGKAEARRIRRSGKVPAVIYGEVEKPQTVLIDAHDFDTFLRKGHSVIHLKIDGKEQQAVIREVQRHPVYSNVLHVDFMGIKKGHKITLSVPISFVGKASGANEGGRFFALKSEVEIEVLPKDVPNEIELSIEDLELNDALRVKDIPAGSFEILDDPEDILCRVEIPKVVEEVTEEEEGEFEEEEESAEPEVITAKDKEESEE